MRVSQLAVVALSLAACAPEVPDSASGVGFNDYSNYQPQANAGAIQSGPIIDRTAISDETLAPGASVPTASPAQTTTAGTTAAQRPPGQTIPRPVNLNNPGISDEQDFGAVASRESIESDRARLEAQRQAYQVIQPTALPNRPAGSFASIVEYALSTSNQVGQSIYRRSGLLAQSRFERNCAKYPSSDLAQEAFLKAGGPQKDRHGLDPDGDGFACYWDPTPFRLVRAGQ